MSPWAASAHWAASAQRFVSGWVRGESDEDVQAVVNTYLDVILGGLAALIRHITRVGALASADRGVGDSRRRRYVRTDVPGLDL